MDYLPQDPAMLVSSINMLLRDEEYDTLESLCFAFDRDPQEIKDRLKEQDFVWNEEQKQFRPAGCADVAGSSGHSVVRDLQ